MGRIKLFSDNRRKLFSSSPDCGIVLRELICKDCGHVIETAEHPSHAICPNCGGKRLDIKLFKTKEVEDTPEVEKTFTRKELFLSDYEKKLKTYSGKQIKKEEFDKLFSADLIEKGFAEIVDDQVNISPFAFEAERTFSKLIISVTKTLELDPEIMRGDVKKEEIIDKLEDEGKIPEKEILILRKAHDIPVEHHYSEDEQDTWVEDSSIIPDLELEYNNQSFGMEQFIKIIRDRYPDAPENILDILVDAGTVRINGTQVTIQSNSKK